MPDFSLADILAAQAGAPGPVYEGGPTGNVTMADVLGPAWLDRAKQQAQRDAEAYQRGGVPELLADRGETADLAGGFGGTTYKAYHGLGAPISGPLVAGHPYRYDPGFMGAGGVYSTNRPHLANDYATLKAAKELEPAPNVMPLNLEMNNPLTISGDQKRALSGLSQHERDQWLQDVYAKGHDGVIVKYGEGDPARRTSGYEEYLAPAGQYSSVFKLEGIRAYHGSPYDFDKFDLSRIGTGEGAQAYGHGLYFAENPAVAQDYRTRLSPYGTFRMKGETVDIPTMPDGPQKVAAQLLLSKDFNAADARYGARVLDPKQFKGFSADDVANEIDKLEKLGASPVGKMYEVNINARPEQFLDYEKPIAEQSDPVREAYKKITGYPDPKEAALRVRETDELMHALASDRDPVTNAIRDERGWMQLARERDKAWANWNRAQSGAKAYEGIAGQSAMRQSPVWADVAPNLNRQAAASELLQREGIPGIRYLDQGSRAAFPQEAADLQKYVAIRRQELSRDPNNQELQAALKRSEGHLAEFENKNRTSNYVVFNPAIVDILKKYGLAGLTMAGVLQGQSAPQPQQ